MAKEEARADRTLDWEVAMPASKVRNAVFGYLQGVRPVGPRLRVGSHTGPASDFDFLAVVARSSQELADIRAAHRFRFRTKPNTISRRRDVVERAEQVGRTLGWEWTDEELGMLARFVGLLVVVESRQQPARHWSSGDATKRADLPALGGASCSG